MHLSPEESCKHQPSGPSLSSCFLWLSIFSPINLAFVIWFSVNLQRAKRKFSTGPYTSLSEFHQTCGNHSVRESRVARHRFLELFLCMFHFFLLLYLVNYGYFSLPLSPSSVFLTKALMLFCFSLWAIVQAVPQAEIHDNCNAHFNCFTSFRDHNPVLAAN